MSEEKNIEDSQEGRKSEVPEEMNEEETNENISAPETIAPAEVQIEKSLPDLPSRQTGEIPKS